MAQGNGQDGNASGEAMKSSSRTPSEPITVGDLVQVVRGHECDLGLVFTVASIEHWQLGWYCPKCRVESYAPYTAVGPAGFPGDGVDITWLKKIPPLSELEGVKTEEDIREPA